jgi:TRAP-type C4-dicarboxylate transport system permease small subunit
MESGFVMVGHMLLIVLVLYVVMRYVLGQNSRVAEDRSVLLGGLALVYMVLYGHGMPGRVNPAIF